MRTSAVTLLLALLAIVLGTFSAIQLSQSNLHSIFGDPPPAVGEQLFDFDPGGIARLNITNSTGTTAVFRWRDHHWRMLKPFEDRADYRHLQSLVLACYALRIEDVIPRSELGLEEAGLEAGHYEIKLENAKGIQVAHFHLGRLTPWHRVANEKGDLAETYFVRPTDREDLIYVCSGPNNVRTLLDSGFSTLRDHRPFLFNAADLAEITIRDKSGELMLSRTTLQSPWFITKPLKLRTNPEAIANLARDLYGLQGLAVHDPDAVTIPARSVDAPYLEISLGFLDKAGKAFPGPTLTVEPPATEGAQSVFASVSNRKAIFDLPLNPTGDDPSLTQLPVSVDELRSPTLCSFDLRTIKSVTLDAPSLAAPLVLSLGKERISGKPRWMISQGPATKPANEAAVARLVTAIAIDEVIDFTSDAAADLKPFGLDPPAKRLVMDLGKSGTVELLFGVSAEGKYYAIRNGTTTVAEVDYGTFSRIPVTPYSWRDSILWPFAIVDLAELRIERAGEAPLDLTYDFIQEKWTAHRKGQDVTHLLNVQRANILANNLQKLHVNRWIGPNAPKARLRLDHPTFTIEAVYRTVDAEGNPTGKRRILMDLASAGIPASNLFYGRLSGDLDFFLLDKTGYDLVDVPLLEK